MERLLGAETGFEELSTVEDFQVIGVVGLARYKNLNFSTLTLHKLNHNATPNPDPKPDPNPNPRILRLLKKKSIVISLTPISVT